jgi:glucose/arabinose dehydrogenase
MRRVALVLILAAGLAAPAAAQAAPRLVPVGSTWDTPMHVAAPPRDPSRLFVLERDGVVRVVVDGVVQSAPFADLETQVTTDGERGLLSIAFPPDYETSGLAYVYLTGAGGELQVRELERSAGNPNTTDGTSRIVWRQAHDQASNHNGGTIDFGPDGLLWLATGDGGGSNDQFGNAQDASSQLGKLIRIDPRPSGSASYTVPPGNPFGTAVFATGLRNPFRFSFDRGTGDLLIGDVGQAAREEIDWVRFEEGLGNGGNFGWPCFEGFAAGPRPCTPAGYVAPIHDYVNGPGQAAVAGGFVVRDPGLPTMLGRYVYADTYAGDIRSLVLGRPATGDRSEGLPPRPLLVSFGEDACGHLHVVTLSGTVERVQDGALGPCVLKPDPRALPGSPGSTPSPTPTPGPPIGPAAADTKPPSVRARVSGKRTIVPRRRLRVAVTTDEPATVRASGRLRGIGRFRTVRRQVRAGRRTVLTVRISRRTARRLRRTLRRKRAIAALTIPARDAAGNQRRVTRRVRIARRR